jgi:hypothetical protein
MASHRLICGSPLPRLGKHGRNTMSKAGLTDFESLSLYVQGFAAVAQLLAAVATVAAIFVALYAKKLASWFESPLLRVSLNNDVGELVLQADNHYTRYHHLRIKNERHWSMAKTVVVEVVKLERKRHDGRWELKYDGRPFPLPWQQESLLGKPDIGMGREVLCDIGYIKDDPHGFGIQGNPCPHGLDPWVRADQVVRLTVEAICDTARSKPCIIEISWNGKWDRGNAEMARHLVLHDVTAQVKPAEVPIP